MDVGELVRVELGRHDWASLRCGCGDSAEHVPLLFEAIITAESPRDMIGYTLDRHVEVNTVLFECTVPAVSVILAALAGELSTPARAVLLQTLSFVAAGSDHGSEPVPGQSDWGDACRAMASEGFWLLVGIGLAGSAEEADVVADICEYFGLGDEKSAACQALLRARVRSGRRHALRRGDGAGAVPSADLGGSRQWPKAARDRRWARAVDSSRDEDVPMA